MWGRKRSDDAARAEDMPLTFTFDPWPDGWLELPLGDEDGDAGDRAGDDAVLQWSVQRAMAIVGRFAADEEVGGLAARIEGYATLARSQPHLWAAVLPTHAPVHDEAGQRRLSMFALLSQHDRGAATIDELTADFHAGEDDPSLSVREVTPLSLPAGEAVRQLVEDSAAGDPFLATVRFFVIPAVAPTLPVFLLSVGWDDLPVAGHDLLATAQALAESLTVELTAPVDNAG